MTAKAKDERRLLLLRCDRQRGESTDRHATTLERHVPGDRSKPRSTKPNVQPSGGGGGFRRNSMLTHSILSSSSAPFRNLGAQSQMNNHAPQTHHSREGRPSFFSAASDSLRTVDHWCRMSGEPPTASQQTDSAHMTAQTYSSLTHGIE